MKLQRFWQRRVVNPILALLKQGVTPDKIALSIAFGVAIGVLPVLGVTTIICALVAILLRLNLPAIQLANYLVYPLQFAFLIPFYRAGEWLFDTQGQQLTVASVVTMIDQDMWHAIRFLWDTTMHALVVWCMLAPIAVGILYYAFRPILRRLPFHANSERPSHA